MTRSPALGHRAEDLDDAHHDVCRPEHRLGIDGPAPAAVRESDECLADAGVGRGVARVAQLYGAGQHTGDGRRERVVHLGDEERQDVVGILPPLGAGPLSQLVQGQGLEWGRAHQTSLIEGLIRPSSRVIV